MKQQLTPKYAHDKIADPTCADLVDVFEDAWSGYILAQVETLLRNRNGDIAAMTLLSSYFEAIEALHRGTSSDGQSAAFFVNGFLRVFNKDSGIDEAAVAAKAIYRHVRCGVAHTGFPTRTVHFQRTKPNAFILTYRRLPNGQLDTRAPVESVLVNAQRMYDAVSGIWWATWRGSGSLRRPPSNQLSSTLCEVLGELAKMTMWSECRRKSSLGAHNKRIKLTPNSGAAYARR